MCSNACRLIFRVHLTSKLANPNLPPERASELNYVFITKYFKVYARRSFHGNLINTFTDRSCLRWKLINVAKTKRNREKTCNKVAFHAKVITNINNKCVLMRRKVLIENQSKVKLAHDCFFRPFFMILHPRPGEIIFCDCLALWQLVFQFISYRH